MIHKTIGFIGTGRMGTALVKGMISSGFSNPEDIYIYDVSFDAVTRLANETKVVVADSIEDAVASSEVVIIAVKPQVIDEVVEHIANSYSKEKVLISIAAGIPTSRIEALISGEPRVVRVMPNAPSLVGAGMTAISGGANVSDDILEYTADLFRSVGESEIIEERLIDQVTALSGSGPAYYFLLTEALITSAMEIGLPKDKAGILAAQTLYGSGLMLKQTGLSAEELRAMVTSPKGTTQAAINVFEKEGFRKMVSKALSAALQRASELGCKDSK